MKASFNTSCQKACLTEIRQFIESQLNGLAISSADRYKIVLAIDEACANAIIHGNACDQQREIKIDWLMEAKTIQVDIYDIGDYRPDEADRMLDLQQKIKEKNKGGLGLFLIHQIMDQVRFFKHDNVNICQLTKQLEF